MFRVLRISRKLKLEFAVYIARECVQTFSFASRGKQRKYETSVRGVAFIFLGKLNHTAY